MSLEVESTDVVKLVLQFLRENNFSKSLEALQTEAQVGLNTVDSIDKLSQNILHGKWDAVLEVTTTLKIDSSFFQDLYEHIVLELAELRELQPAREILEYTPPMRSMKETDPSRYIRLSKLVDKPVFNYTDAYPNKSTKEDRRKHLAKGIRDHVIEAPPSRLLALVTQALKWQQYQGILPKGAKYDLFRGKGLSDAIEEEQVPTKPTRKIKFGKGSSPECCVFSPDGQWLVSGSSDGFVEVWDHETGKLSKELTYQEEDNIMMHDNAVLALAFSSDSDFLASGSSKGELKIWRLLTGTCVRKFAHAHTSAITAIAFARNGTQLVTASNDGTARIHGLKSGRTLKEFRGHTGTVTCVIYSKDGSRLITGGDDGTVKIWDAKSTDCIHSFQPNGTRVSAIISIALAPHDNDLLLICDRSPAVRLTTASGKVVHKYTTTGKAVSRVTTSSKGAYYYVMAEDNVLFSYENMGTKTVHVVKLHEQEVTALCCHPHKNVLVSASADGTMKLWRP